MIHRLKKQSVDLIDPIAEARLDEALNEQGQQFVAQTVKRLPNDEPSMAWRGQLNQRLLSHQASAQRKRRKWAVLRPMLGAAAATALAFAIFLPQEQISKASVASGLEDNVIAAHRLAQRNYELTGSSIVSPETNLEQVPSTQRLEWEEVDLGAL